MEYLICFLATVRTLNRSLRAERHLGPYGTRLNKMLEPGFESLYKHAGQVVYRNKEKQIRRQEMKEKKTMATSNKSSLTILLSAFGTRERRFLIQSQIGLNSVWP